ncbi:MAG: hypothetical protein KDD50_11105 [Bdellovibrionales bacterium]|nr:hypothetical protein [Bdellovibrionales bacterium]
MPRKKLIYTHEYPYHITARSNNKDSFYLPKEKVWNIFICNLNKITEAYGFQCHEFLLMSNHYHLIGSTTTKLLGDVFCFFQKSVSSDINSESKRVNHVFGGPYKPSLITTPAYYYHVYKYLYRNPVQAKVVNRVQDYPFSTLQTNKLQKFPMPKLKSIESGINCHVPSVFNERLDWLNREYSKESHQMIQKGLRRTTFKIVSKSRRTRTDLNFQ